ncbi:unnamed protein product [Adineta steineri]|uniref:Uncharacterized protein n=1 Tax=Adineta steineri TaxID=433720 RepID=A0A819RL56_9BILA|nr:unnamed protein product [Adineta steineri]CAF0802822.1 unnamed protein product [Adineta steineri]CAF4049343.1 unnamed protein product [Adineta steineri]
MTSASVKNELVFSYENINCSSIFYDWISFQTQTQTPGNGIDFLIYILTELRNYIEEYNLISTDHIRDTLTILYRNINSLAFDNVAKKTGSSLHTLVSDVESLGSLKVGDTLRTGSGVYRLDATGFVRIA